MTFKLSFRWKCINFIGVFACQFVFGFSLNKKKMNLMIKFRAGYCVNGKERLLWEWTFFIWLKDIFPMEMLDVSNVKGRKSPPLPSPKKGYPSTPVFIWEFWAWNSLHNLAASIQHICFYYLYCLALRCRNALFIYAVTQSIAVYMNMCVLICSQHDYF